MLSYGHVRYIHIQSHKFVSFYFVLCCTRPRSISVNLTCVMETIAATFIPLKWRYNSFRFMKWRCLVYYFVLLCLVLFSAVFFFQLSTTTKNNWSNHGWLRGQRQKNFINFLQIFVFFMYFSSFCRMAHVTNVIYDN